MVQLCSAPPRRASQDILGCGGLGFGDPGGNSAEWFVFWTVLGIPNFQVTQAMPKSYGPSKAPPAKPPSPKAAPKRAAGWEKSQTTPQWKKVRREE